MCHSPSCSLVIRSFPVPTGTHWKSTRPSRCSLSVPLLMRSLSLMTSSFGLSRRLEIAHDRQPKADKAWHLVFFVEIFPRQSGQFSGLDAQLDSQVLALAPRIKILDRRRIHEDAAKSLLSKLAQDFFPARGEAMAIL